MKVTILTEILRIVFETIFPNILYQLHQRISVSQEGLSGLHKDVFLTVGPGIAKGKKYTSRSRVQKIGK